MILDFVPIYVILSPSMGMPSLKYPPVYDKTATNRQNQAAIDSRMGARGNKKVTKRQKVSGARPGSGSFRRHPQDESASVHVLYLHILVFRQIFPEL